MVTAADQWSTDNNSSGGVWGESKEPVQESPKKKGFDAEEFMKVIQSKKRASQPKGKLAALSNFVASICAKFVDMAKQAINIAVSKFLLELCAMVIAAVGGGLTKKFARPVEITTPGVYYNGSNQPAQANTQQQPSSQGSLWGGSAFDSGWSSNRASSW